MKTIVDNLREEIKRTVQLDTLHHDAANRIEELECQLEEATAIRENCTLVPTIELKKMQEQLENSKVREQQLLDIVSGLQWAEHAFDGWGLGYNYCSECGCKESKGKHSEQCSIGKALAQKQTD